MSEILENALDSIRMGLAHFQDEELETRDKWAILELFHAIELLLKERLFREHHLLIYRNINKVVGDDAQTVGLQETLERFGNLDVHVPVDDRKILLDLQRRRNRIEHHRFVPDPSHQSVLGEALKFIGYFLEEHLDEDLEDHLPAEQFHKAKELIWAYEELVRRAKASLEAARSRLDPKEDTALGTCPLCGNTTVLVGVGDESLCHFCDRPVVLSLCNMCGEYLPPDDFGGADICRGCFSNMP